MKKEVFIDIDKALAAPKKKKRDSAVPEIEIISISVLRNDHNQVIEDPVPALDMPGPPVARRTEGLQLKGDIQVELEEQMRNLRIARARVSNQYPQLVRDGASSRDLAARHAEIESYTLEMQDVYSKIRHVERFGKLPDPEPAARKIIDSEDLIKLQEYRRSLVDKRCKLQAKLRPNARTPKNSERYTMWALELDQVNVEYDQLKTRIREVRDVQS